jgi:IS1 family transposase
MTRVDRATRCILGWRVVPERTSEVLQSILDQLPYAEHYYSDGFTLYESGIYGAPYTPCYDKRHTFSVEADNAEMRHYLARLARKSRCFSRSVAALRDAIHLFAWAWNRRQLHKRRFPRYPAHLRDFISVPI